MEVFEVGKEYTHGWIGDSELFTTWKVIARTSQFITIQAHEKDVKRCKINKRLSGWEGCEVVEPFGRYSMSPILRAKDAARN